MSGVVILGAGQAGFSVASKLRAEGYDKAITLIGDEPVPPYQRPPLSKAYLLGELSKDRLLLRPENFYAEANITLRLGHSADLIDVASQTVVVNDDRIAYEHLVLAVGSAPRSLPEQIGGKLDGVYTIRNLADADSLASAFHKGAKVLVVGGGYIGLEAAAVARKVGLEVTLVEAADRILQRVASPDTADYFRALHTNSGVTVIEGTGLKELAGENGKVSTAILSDGRDLDVDFVVVGIGVDPATDLAEDAGVTALWLSMQPMIRAATWLASA